MVVALATWRAWKQKREESGGLVKRSECKQGWQKGRTGHMGQAGHRAMHGQDPAPSLTQS